MQTAPRLITVILCLVASTAVLAHKNAVPDDYPDHTQHSDGCTQPVNIVDLQTKLQDYNVARVQVADVLYSMADSYTLNAEVSERLLGFAALFEKLGTELPPPDPGSDAFRNFDFKLGLSLTAVTVYLSTEDESLTRQFKADQNNPDSKLGTYLTRLDRSRETYTSGLESYNRLNKTGTC
jgi:hypothetical protein